MSTATFFVFLLLNIFFNAADLVIDRPLIPNFQDFHLVEDPLEIPFNPTPIILNDPTAIDNIFDFKEADVKYYLYTKDNKEQSVSLRTNDTAGLKNSSFNSAWPTKIIIHGWLENGNALWLRNMALNYLNVGDYNVICINWFPASVKRYFTSVKLTRQVGEYVAAFLEFLKSEAQLSLDDVHVVGHSLGSHIAGYIGNYVSNKLGRITGLDPAQQAYEIPYLKDPEDRLDSTDANFVDVIHTCAGGFGIVESIGHADFYPNGGGFPQPGCSFPTVKYCSHIRSYQFFAESIVLPDSFFAVRHDIWMNFQFGTYGDNFSNVIMGEFTSYDTRGIFYLETNAHSPFGKGAIDKTGKNV